MSFIRAEFRTFVHATESDEKVHRAFSFAVGDAVVTEKKIEGHFGNPLVILESSLTRKRDINAFLERMKGTGIIEELRGRVMERMDENCNLHFRLDKNLALEGKLALAEGKNVIDCSLKAGAYPANKENACRAAEEHLASFV